MKKALILAAAAAVLAAGAVSAEESPDFAKVFGGLVLTDGNKDSLNATLGADSKQTRGDNELLANLLFAYGETEDADGVDVKSADKLTAGAQLNHKYGDALYAYLKADYLQDDLAQVDYRVTVGPGVGYKIGPGAVEAGAVYITEDVAGVTDDKVAYRFAEKSEYKLGEKSRFYQEVEYLPTADDFDDYLINAKAGVDAAVNATLSLTVFVLDKYDSTPAPGLEKNDVTVNAGFTYNL